MKYIFATLLFMLSLSDALAGQQTVTLSVPGMNCAACPLTVKKALEKVDGVTTIKVDLDKRQAAVTFDDAKAATWKLTQATTDAGYPSTLVTDAQ